MCSGSCTTLNLEPVIYLQMTGMDPFKWYNLYMGIIIIGLPLAAITIILGIILFWEAFTRKSAGKAIAGILLLGIGLPLVIMAFATDTSRTFEGIVLYTFGISFFAGFLLSGVYLFHKAYMSTSILKKIFLSLVALLLFGVGTAAIVASILRGEIS